MDNIDFNNQIHAIWNVFGYDLYVTDTIRNTWIIMALLIIVAIFVRVSLKKWTDVPKGFQNVVELGVEMFEGLVSDSVGHKYKYFGNWYFGVFVFLIVSNWSGLFGLRPPTADLATTLALALATFVIVHFTGITKQKMGYVKGYFEPFAPFAILNILSTVSMPVSLSFRLFGNLLGGVIIMGMFYALPVFLKIGLPAVFHIYFDIFSGMLQALIFTMLGLLYISEKLPED